MRLGACAQSMRIDARLRRFVEQRLLLTLGQFQTRIRRLAIRLVDVDGPPGGADNRCTVVVSLRHGGQVVTHATDTDARAAIDAAVSKTARALAHRLSRMDASAPHRPGRGHCGFRFHHAQIRRLTWSATNT